MSKLAALATLVLVAGCTEPEDRFTPEPEDEALDTDDPPTDPDPPDSIEAQRAVETLSPNSLTFVIHIPRKHDEGWAAYHQLVKLRSRLRARDVFVIEGLSPWVTKLRREFPYHQFHYIAYPDELADAYAAADSIDAIIVDWETETFAHDEAWTIEKLSGYADKIHAKGLIAASAPYWPASFDDGHITRASGLSYELAQIQDDCAHAGAGAFATAARERLQSFRASGLPARDVGVEISLDSFASADNHTSVARSAACTRKAYGKGARAIYLYGNGAPHLDAYFHEIGKLGLREAR